MEEQFSRTVRLITEEKLLKLNSSKVAVFGIGGVGGYIAESLARAGVGEITLVDKDRVSESNINRQIIALYSTVGKPKVEAMRERLLDINPKIKINTYEEFYLPDNADLFNLKEYDYIADAVDTVTAKLELISRAKSENVPIISAMGAGNKLDPTKFEVADIFDTSVCPLCRIMRRELKNRQISSLKVVYSKEPPKIRNMTIGENKKPIPSSISFVPPVMGLIMAGEIIKDLIK